MESARKEINSAKRGSGSNREDLTKLAYQVVPSKEEDIIWASDLITRVYDGNDVIPVELMLDWYRANPDGFYVIKDGDGTRVGNLDLLTFRPDTFQQFFKGEILEKDTSGACLYGAREKSLVRDVYIASLVVPSNNDDQDLTNFGALLAVFKKIPHCIRKMCDEGAVQRGEVNVYALSANAAITKLMVVCPMFCTSDELV